MFLLLDWCSGNLFELQVPVEVECCGVISAAWVAHFGSPPARTACCRRCDKDLFPDVADLPEDTIARDVAHLVTRWVLTKRMPDVVCRLPADFDDSGTPGPGWTGSHVRLDKTEWYETRTTEGELLAATRVFYMCNGRSKFSTTTQQSGVYVMFAYLNCCTLCPL